MKKTDKLTVFLLTFSILTALSLPLSAILPTPEETAIYDSVIRLHVIANSDSEYDQALKLRVRDGILATAAELTDGAENIADAEMLLSSNLDKIKKAAADIIMKSGANYKVRISLTKESYPTRSYGGLTLPAGKYSSLRIMIGKAEGKNWWCVLFPQLCTVNSLSEETVASDNVEKMLSAGLTRSQIEFITEESPDVVIKFRILEMFSEMFSDGGNAIK